MKINVGHNFEKDGMFVGTISARGKGTLTVEVQNHLREEITSLCFRIIGGTAEKEMTLGWGSQDPEIVSNPCENFKISLPADNSVILEIPFEIETCQPQAHLWLVSFETAEKADAA